MANPPCHRTAGASSLMVRISDSKPIWPSTRSISSQIAFSSSTIKARFCIDLRNRDCGCEIQGAPSIDRRAGKSPMLLWCGNEEALPQTQFSLPQIRPGTDCGEIQQELARSIPFEINRSKLHHVTSAGLI